MAVAPSVIVCAFVAMSVSYVFIVAVFVAISVA